jgi:hypothetical protein
MAGKITVNTVQLGDSATATNNFVLKTNVDGTAVLARGNDGATTQDILTIDSSGLLTGDFSVQTGFKNKIIGGDFTINPFQRGTPLTTVASGAYTADRWQYGKAGAMVHTISQSDDAPTVAQAGIYTRYSLGLAVTTIDNAIAVGDYAAISQLIEGLNAASFGFGQAGTRYVTLSFWVKGAKTGIHCVSLRNGAATRSYVAEYTITTANTWQKENITIPVNTESGLWLYDNGIGLQVTFTIAAGTSWQIATANKNTWQTGNFIATSSIVNTELDTIGNNFKIALVQLEAGAIATPFDTRSVGEELALCQRYYAAIDNNSTLPVTATATSNSVRGYFSFPVTMRIAPICFFVFNSGSGAAFAIGQNGGYQSGNHSVTTGFSVTASAEL